MSIDEDLQLSPSGIILILGYKKDFPELRGMNRVKILEVSRDKSFPSVPISTEILFCTRNISHAHYDTARRICNKKGISMPAKLLGTREIKEIAFKILKKREDEMTTREPVHINFAQSSTFSSLEDIGSPSAPVVKKEELELGLGMLVPEKSSGSQSPEGSTKVKKGALKEFVLEFADRDLKNIADEARRLLSVAQSAGISTTFHSLEQAVRKYIVCGEKKKKDPPASEMKADAEEPLRAIESFLQVLGTVRDLGELAGAGLMEIREQKQALQERVAVLEEENGSLRKEIENLKGKFSELKKLLG